MTRPRPLPVRRRPFPVRRRTLSARRPLLPARRTAFPARRIVAAAAAVVTVAVGLAVHSWMPAGFASDALGDILYAVLIHLLVAALLPRTRVWACALIALAWCVAVEGFQLTGLPELWGTISPMFMLIFGTVFSPTDLAMYAVGIALAASVDSAITAFAAARIRAARPDSS